MTEPTPTGLQLVHIKISKRIWARFLIQARIEQAHQRHLLQRILKRYLDEKGTPDPSPMVETDHGDE